MSSDRSDDVSSEETSEDVTEQPADFQTGVDHTRKRNAAKLAELGVSGEAQLQPRGRHRRDMYGGGASLYAPPRACRSRRRPKPQPRARAPSASMPSPRLQGRAAGANGTICPVSGVPHAARAGRLRLAALAQCWPAVAVIARLMHGRSSRPGVAATTARLREAANVEGKCSMWSMCMPHGISQHGHACKLLKFRHGAQDPL